MIQCVQKIKQDILSICELIRYSKHSIYLCLFLVISNIYYRKHCIILTHSNEVFTRKEPKKNVMIYYEIKNKARVENQPVTTQPYNKLFPRKKNNRV